MKNGISKIIGKRIRTKRKKENISQKDLAEKVSVSPAAINQFEKGDKKPSSAILRAIAVALGTSSDYLLGESEDADDLFISEEVAAAFRDFKDLSKVDRDIVLGHIEYLKSKPKQNRK